MRVTCFVCCVVACCLAGCALQAPFAPPQGGAVTHFRAPLDLDVTKTDLSQARTGRASAHCVLGLVAWGDMGLRSAAQDARIKTVEHVDYEYMNILGVYQRTSVIVYGQ